MQEGRYAVAPRTLPDAHHTHRLNLGTIVSATNHSVGRALLHYTPPSTTCLWCGRRGFLKISGAATPAPYLSTHRSLLSKTSRRPRRPAQEITPTNQESRDREEPGSSRLFHDSKDFVLPPSIFGFLLPNFIQIPGVFQPLWCSRQEYLSWMSTLLPGDQW